jgi:hypothetical protein
MEGYEFDTSENPVAIKIGKFDHVWLGIRKTGSASDATVLNWWREYGYQFHPLPNQTVIIQQQYGYSHTFAFLRLPANCTLRFEDPCRAQAAINDGELDIAYLVGSAFPPVEIYPLSEQTVFVSVLNPIFAADEDFFLHFGMHSLVNSLQVQILEGNVSEPLLTCGMITTPTSTAMITAPTLTAMITPSATAAGTTLTRTTSGADPSAHPPTFTTLRLTVIVATFLGALALIATLFVVYIRLRRQTGQSSHTEEVELSDVNHTASLPTFPPTPISLYPSLADGVSDAEEDVDVAEKTPLVMPQLY